MVSARAVVDGPFEPGEYHLQLAGRALGLAAQNITISAVVPAGTPDAGPPEPDAAPDAGDDAPDAGDDDGAGADGDEGGCGCRTARPDGTAVSALLLLAALGLGSRRRRRRLSSRGRQARYQETSRLAKPARRFGVHR